MQKFLLALVTFAVLLGLSTFPAPLFAAALPNVGSTVPLASEYDLAATSYIYCYTVGRGPMATVRGDWALGVGKIKTTGSSTTTASFTASGAALTAVSVGDELLVYPHQLISTTSVPFRRYVTAAASVDSITVNAAWDLSDTGGYTYYIRRRTCSSVSTAGWFGVGDLDAFSVEFKIGQINATSFDFDIECLADDSSGVVQTIWTKNYTAVGGDTVKVDLRNGRVGDQCRVGMKLTGDAGVQKVTINLMVR